MSDLFLGEMLVILLLIPVLLRPFFRSLQGVSGIPILPLLALLSCFAIIAGSGFRFSFLPVFAFTILVFLSGLAQLIRLIRGLPSDWFSTMFVVWNCILLVALVVTLRFSWLVRPELSWMPGAQVKTSVVSGKAGAGVFARYTVRERAAQSAPNSPQKIVLFVGNGLIDSGSRPTLASILASDGWTVVEASWRSTSDYRNILLTLPSLRSACMLGGTVLSGKPFLTDEAEIEAVCEQNIDRIVGFAREKYGASAPLYIVAEGASAKSVASYLSAKPHEIAGSVVLLPESLAASYSVTSANPVLRTGVSGMMPAAAGSYSVLALSGDASFLYGYGELCADDVLAASFLGGVRDNGRKQAELASRRVETWLGMRSSFHEVQ